MHSSSVYNVPKERQKLFTAFRVHSLMVRQHEYNYIQTRYIQDKLEINRGKALALREIRKGFHRR